MSTTRAGPASAAGTRRRSVVGVAVAIAAIIAVLLSQSPPSSASSAFSGSSSSSLAGVPPQAGTRGRAPATPPSTASAPMVGKPGGGERSGAITGADGVLPEHVTAFDPQYPGVANLNPGLLRALRQATTAAAHDGVEIDINSGWRSAQYQDQLLREAVAKYGSATAAARWVATPATSAHVSGNAVDIGPADAAIWLAEHGATYGLCQVYANEPWHFELRPRAVGRSCPPVYADPTDDPRMER